MQSPTELLCQTDGMLLRRNLFPAIYILTSVKFARMLTQRTAIPVSYILTPVKFDGMLERRKAIPVICHAIYLEPGGGVFAARECAEET